MTTFDAEADAISKQFPAIAVLLPGIICSECGATVKDYSEKCTSDWRRPCHGFLAIEGARAHLANAA